MLGLIFEKVQNKIQDPAKLRQLVLAQEIADDLRSALEQIEDVLGDLQQAPGFKQREE